MWELFRKGGVAKKYFFLIDHTHGFQKLLNEFEKATNHVVKHVAGQSKIRLELQKDFLFHENKEYEIYLTVLLILKMLHIISK